MFKKIPKHVGIIPDGNRRWAASHQYDKKDGYFYGVQPGLMLYEILLEFGIQEASIYGFTKDNVKRPLEQRKAFTEACVDVVESVAHKDANILVMGDADSVSFPAELKKYKTRTLFGNQLINMNFLINYDWHWDLSYGAKHYEKSFKNSIASADISRMDLIIRWGGRRRLSGFLPVQSVYADFYIIDDYWPDFERRHFIEALSWYQESDVTLGG